MSDMVVHSHQEAIDALSACAATVTVLSYQEAIEGYFKLRGLPIPGDASAPPVGEGMREKVAAIIRDHVQVGDIGECFVELTGQEEAADAILALLSSGEA